MSARDTGPRPRSKPRLVPLLLLAACGGEAALPAPEPAGDRLHLCVSGELQGRLEPCGCAGGQLGGLPRRSWQIRLQGDYDLLLEGGNLVEGHGELDLLKAFTAVQILGAGPQPYDAIGVGPRDLELPFEEWCAMQQGLPMLASDLECTLPDWPAVPFVDKTVRSLRVRIASLTLSAPAALLQGEAPKLRLLPPAAAWARALAGAEPTALRILMVHGDGAVARRLAAALQPAPDLVVAVDAAVTDPPPQAEEVAPRAAGGAAPAVPLVFSGTRGRMLLDLTLRRLPQGPRLGYDVVRLEGSKTRPGAMTDADVAGAVLRHRRDVAELGVLQQLADQLPTGNGARFVGSAACGQCHAADLQAWQQSRHAHAWQTLVDAEADAARYPWPVTAYPDCVGCHTVGYRQRSGFVDFAGTPQLAAVGCENCHGAGSAHREDPQQHRLGKVGDGTPAVVCRSCHDFEQSPEFDYRKAWRQIAHGKKP